MKTNKTIRIPRPLGTTLMARTIATNPNNKTKIINQIKEHILNQYFINNQTINNLPVTIDQLAKHVQIPIQTIIRFMYKRLGYMQGFSKDDDIDTDSVLRVLKFEALKNSLNSAQIANTQAQILTRKQGTDYVPFLTEQVNSAIRNLFTANADIRDLYRMLQGPKAPQHNSINYYAPGTEPKSDTLTPDSALLLLDKERPVRLLTDGTMKDDLKAQYNIDGLDEVRANYQTGYQTDEEIAADQTSTATSIDSKKRKDKRKGRREKIEGFIDADEIE